MNCTVRYKNDNEKVIKEYIKRSETTSKDDVKCKRA